MLLAIRMRATVLFDLDSPWLRVLLLQISWFIGAFGTLELWKWDKFLAPWLRGVPLV